MQSDQEFGHAFDALGDRLRESVARDVQQTVAQLASSIRQSRDSANDRHLDAIRSIDSARSLTAVPIAAMAAVIRSLLFVFLIDALFAYVRYVL